MELANNRGRPLGGEGVPAERDPRAAAPPRRGPPEVFWRP